MLTYAPFLLALIAFCLAIVSGIWGKVPLWIAVLLVAIAIMVASAPK
jgi:hypothetical protein